MTYRQKLAQEHPESVGEEHAGGCRGCPHNYGYDRRRPAEDWCGTCTCKECWDREMPEEDAQDVDEKALENTGKTAQKSAEHLANVTGAIKDSGNRREFESGAVRDMREGKGRCDLMPLEVVFRCYDLFARDKGEEDIYNAEVFRHIADFQQTNDTEYLLRAIDTFQGYNAWSNMFLEVAKHFEEGAKKYGEGNYKKGLPVWCYIDSAVRHYLKWLRGDEDEPHDRAFVWNLMCCIWEVDYSPRAKNAVGESDGDG